MSIVIKGLNARLGGSASFARDSVAYNPDTGEQVVSGDPRFVAGPFGNRAVLVEEGTENLCPNPSFETGITGWTNQFNDGVFERDTSESYHGIASVKCKRGTGTRYRAHFTVDLQAGEQIRLSAYAKTIAENAVNVRIEYNGGDYSWKTFSGAFHTGSGEWERLFVAGEIATSDCTAYCFIVNSSAENFAYFDAVQAEKKPYPTSFVDGTRAAETLTIPSTSVLTDRGPWTIECWAKANYAGYTHRMPFAAWNKFYVGLSNYDRPQFSWIDENDVQRTVVASSAINNPTDWHYWVFTWDRIVARIYVDADKVIEVETDLPKPLPADLTIGRGMGSYFWNGLIDDLRISSRARTDEEILAAYQSGEPLPVDEWTTLKLALDGDLDWVYYYPLKTDWTAADDYSDPDNLNRVEAYTKYTADTLKDYGYPVTLEPVVVDRDIMTGYEFADSLSRVERNINALAQGFMVLPGYQDPKVWAPGMRFDYQDANRLEMNLQILSDWAIKTAASFKRCGTFTCGEDGDIY